MAEMTYIQAISDGLRLEMRRDPRVFLLGEDVGVYGGAFKVSLGFQEEFGPWRVLDTPLSETAILGGATGAALMGLRPVAEMQFADFTADEEEEIRVHVKKLLNDALERAEASPLPDPATLTEGVYATPEDLDTPHHKEWRRRPTSRRSATVSVRRCVATSASS